MIEIEWNYLEIPQRELGMLASYAIFGNGYCRTLENCFLAKQMTEIALGIFMQRVILVQETDQKTCIEQETANIKPLSVRGARRRHQQHLPNYPSLC